MTPLYNLEILEGSECGVFAISLVQNPAVKIDFIYFEEECSELKFEVINNEKRECQGVIMVANTPILRKENPKLNIPEHYIQFSKDVIKKTVQKFAKEKNFDSIRLGHKDYTTGVYLYESYIIDRENGINEPIQFKDNNIPDGSWIGKFKIENDLVWEEIKKGTYKGFSVDSLYSYQFDNQEDETELYNKELIKIYNLLKNKI